MFKILFKGINELEIKLMFKGLNYEKVGIKQMSRILKLIFFILIVFIKVDVRDFQFYGDIGERIKRFVVYS